MLDRAALVSAWREGLLALAVLEGRTRGYLHHPQLHRFRAHDDPVSAIRTWLYCIWSEATLRGYKFDLEKLGPESLPLVARIEVTSGQLEFERRHLWEKVLKRAPRGLERVRKASPHPLFTVVPGHVEPWERDPQARARATAKEDR